MIRGSRFNREGGDLKTPFLAGKERELLESKKWPSCFSQYVDITKVKIDAFKPWINRRVTELMGVEDEIVVDYCISQLKFFGETDAKANSENAGDGGRGLNEKPYLDPKKLQINLTGFMAKNAKVFVKELWELLIAAQDNEYGIPQKFIDEKKKELTEIENAAKEVEDNIRQMNSDADNHHKGYSDNHTKEKIDMHSTKDGGRDDRSRSPRRSYDRRPRRSVSRSPPNAWYKTDKYSRRRSYDRYRDRRDGRYGRYDGDRRRARRRSPPSKSRSNSYSPRRAARARRSVSESTNSVDSRKLRDHKRHLSSDSEERSPQRRRYRRSPSYSRSPPRRRGSYRSRDDSSYSSSPSPYRNRGGKGRGSRRYQRNRSHSSYSSSNATDSSYSGRSHSSSSGREEELPPTNANKA
ncbi:serine/arginine regulated nuclear matrix like protein [Babesia gibsoni]|uniref:Serine/arginine regulated nuclear matrix like protein n=1 Tax=Babesia gibsoni TaxID=33632 RepID=A0AAD8URU8_BABGI|nr:serine/arginine regulated nuclear matrix like protein [Babesia gibsoni]